MSFLNENSYQLPIIRLNGKIFRNLPDHFQKLPLKNNYHILPYRNSRYFQKIYFPLFDKIRHYQFLEKIFYQKLE